MRTFFSKRRDGRELSSRKSRRLGFETIEPRLAMSGLSPMMIDPTALGGFEAAGDVVLAAEPSADVPSDVGGLGVLPPQRIFPSGGGTDPTVVDFWMTQRPNQELTPDTDLRHWFSFGDLDLGGLSGGSGEGGFPFDNGYGGPTGQDPFGGPGPQGGAGGPFGGFTDDFFMDDFQRTHFSDGWPTGVGEMPIVNPKFGGGLASDSNGDFRSFYRMLGKSTQNELATAGATHTRVTIYGEGQGSTVVVEGWGEWVCEGVLGFQVTYRKVAWASNAAGSQWFYLDKNETIEPAETCPLVITSTVPAKPGYTGPESDSQPSNPHEVFDSVWYVYGNLWAPVPTHDDTRIDILINPRSMTGESDLQLAQSGGQGVAFGGGVAVGPGVVDLLPFVGNRDPNPLNPGSAGASSGISPVLVAALSVRDPVPIQ